MSLWFFVIITSNVVRMECWHIGSYHPIIHPHGIAPEGSFVVKIAISEKDNKALCVFQARRDERRRLT